MCGSTTNAALDAGALFTAHRTELKYADCEAPKGTIMSEPEALLLVVRVTTGAPVNGVSLTHAPDVFGGRFRVEKLPFSPGMTTFVTVEPATPKAKPNCAAPGATVM